MPLWYAHVTFTLIHTWHAFSPCTPVDQSEMRHTSTAIGNEGKSCCFTVPVHGQLSARRADGDSLLATADLSNHIPSSGRVSTLQSKALNGERKTWAVGGRSPPYMCYVRSRIRKHVLALIVVKIAVEKCMFQEMCAQSTHASEITVRTASSQPNSFCKVSPTTGLATDVGVKRAKPVRMASWTNCCNSRAQFEGTGT
eukprot:1139765-Pelagomonas_calceolata.AAC.1